MLVKLLPDQVPKFWNVISYAIDNSVPPISISGQEQLNNILKSILAGRSQAWLEVDKEAKPPDLTGVIITTFMYDEVSEVKNLLIYALFGLKFIKPEVWSEGLRMLKGFAKQTGCHRIVAYTNVPRIVEIVKSLGGQAEFTFVTMEVPRE